MPTSPNPNISGRRFLGQGLLVRRDMIKLILIAGFLVGLLLVGRHLGRTSRQAGVVPHVPESGVAGPGQAELRQLAATDYQRLGVEEKPELLQLLLDWAAAGGPGKAGFGPTTYEELVSSPDLYRGKGITVSGQILRAEQSLLRGVSVEGQFIDAERQIFSFFTPRPLGLTQGVAGKLYGVFYRIAAYPNKRGELEVTPVIILSGVEPLAQPQGWWKSLVAAIAVTLVLLAAILIATRFESGDRQRFRRAVDRLRSGRPNGAPTSTV